MENKDAILIVDDDPILLRMADETLRTDYAVSCVKSGRDALSLLTSDYVPDIILLDIYMPELDGFDTMAALREIDDVQDVPVVFISGMNRPEIELKGLSFGAVDYIIKPFVKEILLARIRVHLENGRRLRLLRMMEKSEYSGWLDENKFESAAIGLTETEKKIMRLIALGYTNQEIGQELNYSYNYVKKVAGIIYEKKCVNKRSDLKKLIQSF